MGDQRGEDHEMLLHGGTKPGQIADGDIVRRHEDVTPLAYYITPDQARLLQDLVDARRGTFTPIRSRIKRRLIAIY